MNVEIYAAMNDDEMLRCTERTRQTERAIAIMHRLRAPGGCPWDAEQTHTSLIPNLIEECYECVDAIREGDAGHLREELGDVLLQVLFHAELAEENSGEAFDIYDVARGLCEKLIRRHPHVFGTSYVENSDAVIKRWDEIKRQERHSEQRPFLHDCGKGLPELLRASKLTTKAAKVGFDWENCAGVIDKINEELEEVQETLPLPDDDPRVSDELGDLLFAAVNLCRKRRINPEEALRSANQKFIRRFNAMEEVLKAEGISLQEANMEQFERAWQIVKLQEHTNKSDEP